MKFFLDEGLMKRLLRVFVDKLIQDAKESNDQERFLASKVTEAIQSGSKSNLAIAFIAQSKIAGLTGFHDNFTAKKLDGDDIVSVTFHDAFVELEEAEEARERAAFEASWLGKLTRFFRRFRMESARATES